MGPIKDYSKLGAEEWASMTLEEQEEAMRQINAELDDMGEEPDWDEKALTALEAPWAEIRQDCLFVRAVGRQRCVELYQTYLATQCMYGWSMDRMAGTRPETIFDICFICLPKAARDLICMDWRVCAPARIHAPNTDCARAAWLALLRFLSTLKRPCGSVMHYTYTHITHQRHHRTHDRTMDRIARARRTTHD